MPNLMDSFQLKELTLKNRVVMSPMCQYSATGKDGMPTDWHLHHYTSRAIGGVGLIIVEMTNVEPNGRISDYCLGLWSDAHRDAFKPIVDAAHQYGAKIAIQIAHAGRKAEDAPEPVAPSAQAFDETYKTPRALSENEIAEMVQTFKAAARRAVEAGFDAIELHGAHGYLIHQFLSPYTNTRTDRYGKDRTLFAKEVIRAVKSVIPDSMPLLMRISATEYVDGGYDIEEAIRFSQILKDEGVDIFDVSSGGEGPIGSRGLPGSHAGYQTPLAKQIKQALSVPVIAVGRLENPVLANAVIGNEEADLIAVGRGLLANPYWALGAASELQLPVEAPTQYKAGF
ncbi:NADH:flavin oxidoreductase/NADH oxidase [Shouchella clausii]|uniref:NADH:flavin oxidoreductase/NADH oxidase n=1 Tax=Shouchella clausii TaxID=79880 RepID=A0A268P3R7_SHOCL|nr:MULTISPECIES: NADH:flavin oxidoreductase/NADH oxidase [Shouchella]ALA54656.1 NADPH dehydrogenase [Shouchella clausii]KKI84486.1 NADPH dehydrogenase [Shouchella clausii]MBU3230643.1 NADH:flavin oxidoreductase/NADH oxidase [Shouchella clausii]MBU3263282.1 NADH:flavin oxidoreductase/NADH oxidase [Shouchella clausii]MBU3505747.1 NADH:flavin oxidoreductase/NADH oxidase [Shouchella clausii]